jgi:hypothetical protein
MADMMKIEILADGTIKFITDPISGPNHVNAEAFLRDAARLAGGDTTREARTDKAVKGAVITNQQKVRR